MSEFPETQYATSDGHSIAYQVWGGGPNKLVVVPGIVSHLEENLKRPDFLYFLESLARYFHLIIFDKRGTGMSDRISGAPTIDERARDIEAVMDAARFDTAALTAFSEGSALALVFAARNPTRISKLVIGGGYAAGGLLFGEKTEAQLEQTRQEFLENWGKVGGQHPLALHGPKDSDADSLEEFARFCRMCATPSAIAAVNDMNNRFDVRDVLPMIQQPTLVLRRKAERLSRARCKHIADNIPGAIYRELPGDEHPPYRGNSDDYITAIRDFVLGESATAVVKVVSQRVLASVLFTDIVGSTEHQARLGDRAFSGLLNQHDALSKRLIEQHNGRFVNGTGDGLLATFNAPTDAISCADAIRDGVTCIDLTIRAGVHTGEIEIRGDDISGISVNIAARIANQAIANEILTSDLTRQLMIGSQVTFESRGDFELKGVPGAWPLFAASL